MRAGLWLLLVLGYSGAVSFFIHVMNSPDSSFSTSVFNFLSRGGSLIAIAPIVVASILDTMRFPRAAKGFYVDKPLAFTIGIGYGFFAAWIPAVQSARFYWFEPRWAVTIDLIISACGIVSAFYATVSSQGSSRSKAGEPK